MARRYANENFPYADYPGQAARIDAALGATGELRGRLIRVNRPPS